MFFVIHYVNNQEVPPRKRQCAIIAPNKSQAKLEFKTIPWVKHGIITILSIKKVSVASTDGLPYINTGWAYGQEFMKEREKLLLMMGL